MSKNLSAKYYQENKERLQKKPRERYQTLSKDEKEKKRQYGRERYKNLSEDEKQILLSIEKNILEREKTLYYNYIKGVFQGSLFLKHKNSFLFRKDKKFFRGFCFPEVRQIALYYITNVVERRH